jgi:Flp pilus assembly protein TadD
LQKRWSDATKVFRKALELNPSNAKAHYNLGLVMTEEGKLVEAERELKEAILLQPGYDQAHNNLGIVYAKQTRNEAALMEFHKAVSLNPSNNEALRNIQAMKKELKYVTQKPNHH